MTIRITYKDQIYFCPQCGQKTERKEVPITDFKTNLVVECPKHGEITVK